MSRTEFGVERTSCRCRDCQTNCRFMPGFLIPADLERMIPPGDDPFLWAERNLLASPGAIVASGLEVFRVPTLVPAIREDGSCIHLVGGRRNGRCAIWERAPFGCAFFSCRPEPEGLAGAGLAEIAKAREGGLYRRLWRHLWEKGLRQLAPEVLRERMKEAR